MIECVRIITMTLTSDKIKERAYELGFVLAGVAPAGRIDDDIAAKFEDYISSGRNAGMGYMARNVEKRMDVRKMVEGARSVICCAVSYNNEVSAGGGDELYVARYARCEDYHYSVRRKLKELAGYIESELDDRPYMRMFVDSAPLVEKYYAVKAGLGWQGKNTLLLNKEYGSRLLLGEIVIDVELEYDKPVGGSCGDCDLCMRACPSGALPKAGKLNSYRCISYQTYETKDEIPDELAARLGGRVFGCDSCQDVCPYNKEAKKNVDSEYMERFGGVSKTELERMSEEEFKEKYGDTPLYRAGLERLRATANKI